MATIEVNQSDSVFNLTSFELFSTDGTQFDLSKVNSRYILLDFWHKGCIPCLKAIPHINALKMTFSDEEVSIFGINPIDNLNNIKETIKQKNISYCVLADKNRSLSKLLSINAYPTILIIDTKRNKIVYSKSGFNEEIDNEITLILKNLLKSY